MTLFASRKSTSIMQGLSDEITMQMSEALVVYWSHNNIIWDACITKIMPPSTQFTTTFLELKLYTHGIMHKAQTYKCYWFYTQQHQNSFRADMKNTGMGIVDSGPQL